MGYDWFSGDKGGNEKSMKLSFAAQNQIFPDDFLIVYQPSRFQIRPIVDVEMSSVSDACFCIMPSALQRRTAPSALPRHVGQRYSVSEHRY
jgi:hypothetical protein